MKVERPGRRRAVLQLASCSAIALSIGLVDFGVASAQVAGRAQTGVEEVIVTARRREERLLDVPVAVTALSAEQLNRYAVRNFSNLTQIVPNVVVIHLQAGGGGLAQIRGMGSQAASGDIGVSPEVAYNFDGIGVTRGRISQLSMLDPAQLEVLKGPQALYFGKNSPAGVISVSSPDPGQTFTGYLRTGYEKTRAAVSADAAVTLPINDMLSIRLAMNARHQRGHVINYAIAQRDPIQPAFIDPGATHKYQDGSNQNAGRISVKFTPTENFSAVVKYLHGRYRANSELGDLVLTCGYGVTTAYSGFGGIKFFDPTNPNCSQTPYKSYEPGLNPAMAANFPYSNGGVPYSRNLTDLISGVLTYDLGQATVTSTSGLYRLKNQMFSGNSFTSFPFYFGGQQSRYRQVSEELRVQTKLDGPINAMVGGYYESSRNTFDAANYFFPVPPDTRNGRISSDTIADHGTNKTSSVFGSVEWKLANQVTVTAGARYTHEKKVTVLQNSFVNNNTNAFRFFVPEGTVLTVPNSGSNVSPEVSVSYHPQPNMNLYAAYKTGYKSGGTSQASVLSNAIAQQLSFKPEKAKGFEVGFKGDLLDGRLFVNSDVYYYKFTNLQVSTFIAALTAPTFLISNAAAAATKGAEVEATYRIDPDFSVRARAAYNHAYYTNYPNAPCSADQTAGVTPGCVGGVTNLTGTTLRRAPKWNAGAGLTYSHDLAGSWRFTADGDASYTSSFFATTNPDPNLAQSGFVLLNASIKFYNSDNGLSFSVSGQNLTDKLVLWTRANGPGQVFGLYQALPGPPREITFAVAYDF